jgi:hypothetical protein
MIDIVANLVALENKTKYLSHMRRGEYTEFDEILSLGEDAIPTLMNNIDWAPWNVMLAIAYITNCAVNIPLESRGKIDDMVACYKAWYDKEFVNEQK